MIRSQSILLVLAAMVAVALIGWIDYVTGPSLSLGPLYLLPILGVAWRRGRRAALQVAVVAAVAWFCADIGYRSQLGVSIWNASTRLVTFGVVGWAVASLRGSEQRLRHMNARLHVLLDREASLANTDPLTGILNRRGFAQHCRIELARAHRSHSSTGLIYIDIDNFKVINDRHGHAAGDKVLEQAGALIRSSVRETDICGRIGGDEFAVFCWNPTRALLYQAADRITQRIQELAIDSPVPGFGASAGVVWFETPPEDLEQLLQLADEEMYRIKRARARKKTGREREDPSSERHAFH